MTYTLTLTFEDGELPTPSIFPISIFKDYEKKCDFEAYGIMCTNFNGDTEIFVDHLQLYVVKMICKVLKAYTDGFDDISRISYINDKEPYISRKEVYEKIKKEINDGKEAVEEYLKLENNK